MKYPKSEPKKKGLFDRILCKIGLHKWKQDRPLYITDIYPMFGKTPERICTECKKKQHWLPGYGGSEIGSWQKGGN